MYALDRSTIEVQSSAFTEIFKSQIGINAFGIEALDFKFLNSSAFGSGKGKISLSKTFEIMGQTALTNSVNYTGSTVYDVSLAFRNTGLYNDLFDELIIIQHQHLIIFFIIILDH